MDVNRHRQGRSTHEYDQVDIICPTYNQNVVSDENTTERFIIYHVTKEEYDSCRIFDKHPRIIAQCNFPFRKLFFTISFRSFSPTPGALEFKPGFDYHFISTSSKQDIKQLENGMCHTHNMKVVFKVADKLSKTNTFPQNSQKLNNKRTRNDWKYDKIQNKQIEFHKKTDQMDNPKGNQNDRKRFKQDSSLIRKKSEYPKSLDYFLYPNKNKEKQLDGAFKQEASTSNTVPSPKYCTAGISSSLVILMYVVTFACFLLFE